MVFAATSATPDIPASGEKAAQPPSRTETDSARMPVLEAVVSEIVFRAVSVMSIPYRSFFGVGATR